jgi:hypothetical protein
LKDWPIVLPSRADQSHVVERLQGIETIVKQLQVEMLRAETRQHALRKALLGAAFSGQLAGRSSVKMDQIKAMAGV